MTHKLLAKLKEDPRLARVFKGGVSGVAGKATTVLVSAITLPLTVRYLGPQQYGLWVTISTTVAMLAVMDLGVAYTLTNLISTAYANDDRLAARRYYATAFWTSITIALVLGAAAFLAWPSINWGDIFHVNDRALIHEVSTCVAIALGYFLLSLPLNLVHRVLGGYQQTQITNYFNILRNVLSLIAILVVVKVHGSLVMLMVVYSVSLLFGTVILNLWVNFWDRRWILPAPQHVNKAAIGNLLSTSSGFFLLQLAGLIVFNSDNIVITHYLGAAEVTPYAVAWRLAAYAVVLQSAISPSLWPAYSEAWARGDLAWIRKTFWRMARFICSTTFVCLLFFGVAGRTLLRWYVGPAAVPGSALLWVICGWTMISACMEVEACLLAAIGRVRLQGVLGVIAAAINIVASIFLVQRIGTIGVVAGTAISYVLVIIVPQTMILWNALYPPGKDRKNNMFGPMKDSLLAIAKRAVYAVYPPAMEALLVHGFRLATFAARTLHLLPSPPALPPGQKRIMVVYLSPHMGDAVMLMPMLERLREAHPEARVELAIDSPAAPMFRMLPCLDQVHALKMSDGARGRFSAVRGVWRSMRAYRETMANLPVNVCVMPRWRDDPYRSQNLAYLLGAPRRIGWKSYTSHYRDGLLTEKYPGGDWTLDSVRFCRLIALAGLIPAIREDEIARSPVFSLRQIASASAWEGIAGRVGIDTSRPFAVISTGASHPSRRWPIERWRSLMSWLRERGLDLVLLSGPGDADIARQLYELDNERTVLVAGTTSLIESVTLISHAAMFLGNDSGPGHIAGALGIPTLICMATAEGNLPGGPSSPVRILPLGPHVAYCQPKACVSPCRDYCTARNAHCIRGISVEQAILKLEELWREALQPHSVLRSSS